MTGDAKKNLIISGDSNIVNLNEPTDTKLPSAGFTPLITVLTIAAVSLGLTIILFGYFSAETKAKTDYFQIIVTIITASAICISFMLALSKVYKNIKALIIILIPLCMAFSIASAAYLLDKSPMNIIDRILSLSDVECPPEPDFPINPPCAQKYNEIRVDKPDIECVPEPDFPMIHPCDQRHNEIRVEIPEINADAEPIKHQEWIIGGFPGGYITGQITDNNGNPISDATISTDNKSTLSMPDGRYLLTSIAGKEVRLTVSAPGYYPMMQNIWVKRGEVYSVNFILKPNYDSK